jgi:hypothetical protein
MSVASLPRPSTLMPSRRARGQIGVVLFAYLLYSAARWLTVGDLPSAQAHAQWIVDRERDLHVAAEASVQKALTGTPVLWVLNHLYIAAQLLVVPGTLVFLYLRNRPLYERLRNTILATWLLSIPVYAAFPVAPPRLADIGIVDTITSQTQFSLNSRLTTSFYNEFAAVPSLHVGFAVAVGFASPRPCAIPWRRASRCCGGRRSPSPWSPPATTSSSTSPPASSSARWDTPWRSASTASGCEPRIRVWRRASPARESDVARRDRRPSSGDARWDRGDPGARR